MMRSITVLAGLLMTFAMGVTIESVVFAPNGSMVLLDKYGFVQHARPTDDSFKIRPPVVAYLGPGRPLGSHFDSAGNLIICDSLKGLTMLEAETGRLVLLSSVTSADSPIQPGTRIAYANDVDIASDGTIYFSDSQRTSPMLNTKAGFWDTMQAYMHNLFAAETTGRLLKYTPSTGRTEVLMHAIFYANGVALSADESFVAVVETSRNRVLRYWLKGEKAGTFDILLRLLPCWPDGISPSSDGNFWLACVIPMSDMPKFLSNKAIRTALAWLNYFHIRVPQPKAGIIFKVDPDGEIIKMVMDPDGSVVSSVSAITEHEGKLYFGNLMGNYVSVIDVDATGPDYGWRNDSAVQADEKEL